MFAAFLAPTCALVETPFFPFTFISTTPAMFGTSGEIAAGHRLTCATPAARHRAST